MSRSCCTLKLYYFNPATNIVKTINILNIIIFTPQSFLATQCPNNIYRN